MVQTCCWKNLLSSFINVIVSAYPQAFASELSYIQEDKHRIAILYHINKYRPCT